MKEINCKVEFTDELWAALSEQMDELGQIHVEGCGDAVVEVMPVDQKNFINEVSPVLELFLTIGGNIVVGVLSEWLCTLVKNKMTVSVEGYTVQVSSKEELSKVLTFLAHEKEKQ